ncbi:hypothetical protein C943_00203 [Mariniradius saccharolyticus AK6]|uniref:Uncharacterized protein n=1 Tax=Mariniradius saccharolyticus AK6 TaxID=1239962 RepID=M7XDB5_9BACT|nr:hypothetical protein C943_00203 [Mariniradius saccharolyticus AK6]
MEKRTDSKIGEFCGLCIQGKENSQMDMHSLWLFWRYAIF